MIQLCQLTEISKHDLPELIQFYRHIPKKYPFLFTTSSQNSNFQEELQHSNFDILFVEPDDWLQLDHHLKLSSSDGINVLPDEFFLDAFDRWFVTENKKQGKLSDKPEAISLPFTGGWFVFLSYELAQQVEPCLNLNFDDQLLPVAYAARVKKAVIYDHKQGKYFFISESDIDHQSCLQSLLNDVKQIESFNSTHSTKLPKLLPNDFNDSLYEEQEDIFLNSVDTVRNFIKEGDVFQVNLSRLWDLTIDSTLSNHNHYEQACLLSHRLSKENPAPYSGLASIEVENGIASIISSSPERLLKVKEGVLESRPIAGTHPRSRSEKEDMRLLDDLHSHPKEQAEHIMLIDLIRNDLGRVCIPGTVTVDELMTNESYAHVHHIVSNVKGKLQADKTPAEIIKALFPGGTITGCPKVRCMEIISELEQKSRGAYTGSMGYVNLDGSMDLNILIRTMVLETVLETDLATVPDNIGQHKLSFRAGAGLVFDSIAQKELQETRAKAKGLLRALQVSTK